MYIPILYKSCLQFLPAVIGLLLLTFQISDAQSSINHKNIYHINQERGSNQFPGTENKPFLTIQKCAELAQAGDTCLVHTGIYRETVHPVSIGQKKLPITFIAATGENVVVTGLDKLTTPLKMIASNLYVTTPNSPVKQLFIGDTISKIAQSPNSNNYFKPNYSIIDSAECKTVSGKWSSNHTRCRIYDEDGTCNTNNNCWNKSFPKQLWRISSGDLKKNSPWQGAIIAIINEGEYNAERAIINPTSVNNKIEFEWFNERPLKQGLKFSITNSLSAIDEKNEWAYDSNKKLLYINIENPKFTKDIYIRTRKLAFDLRRKHYITVKGFELFAASIETDEKSTNNILDHLNVMYPTYHQMFGATGNFPGQGANRHKISSATQGKGITIGGKNNILKNSIIAHSWCDGVTVYGTNNSVFNNTIHDVNWGMTACAGITTTGKHHQIQNNTIYNCGRACLWHQRTFETEFSYNEIFNACWLGKDCGVTASYAWYGKNNDISSDIDGDGIGNIFHHNWIHDNKNKEGGSCIYLDNDEQNYLLHHNVLWNCKFAFILNDTYIEHLPTGHQIFNNTCFQVEFRSSDFGNGSEWQLQGVKFKNNLCTTSRDRHYNFSNTANIEMTNNIGPDDPNTYAQGVPAAPWTANDLGLIDVTVRDFRLNKNSPATNQGVYIPGITDGSIESPPSAGAYGLKNAWKAGTGSPQ